MWSRPISANTSSRSAARRRATSSRRRSTCAPARSPTSFAAATAICEPGRDLSSPEALVGEARGVLREKFLAAEVGITGANFLVAETGSAIVVTNEGNADLTMSLPKVHIVLASIDKVVPTLNDAWPLLRLLARSATGQEFTAYTTLVTGPRRAGDVDGPEACHVVILDNGRSELLRSKLRPVLRCIRCGACMNHCPVYCSIGGHAYGSVYPGPIGAVLTPALAGTPEAGHLAQASTFCGRCEEVCPVEIPLVSLMRHWREVAIDEPGSRRSRTLLRAWAFLAERPRAYRSGGQDRRCRTRRDGARQRETTYAAIRRALDAPPRLSGAAGAHLSRISMRGGNARRRHEPRTHPRRHPDHARC